MTNIIGGVFLFGSLISLFFIEENLKRLKKDAEIKQENNESINSNRYTENEEYLLNSKKLSNKSNISEPLGI